MGTGASAGGAHVADDLALGNGIALGDDVVGHVGIETGVAVTVVDGDVVAVGTAIGGHGDLTAAGSPDGGAPAVGQVHAVVELVLSGDRMDPVAVGRGQLDPGTGTAPALLAGGAAAASGTAAGITAGAAAVGAAVVGAAVAGALSEQEAEASGDLEDVTPSYQEPEIDNRVFDDYQNQTKVFSLNQPSGEKDYGSYFDDEEDVKPGKKSVPMEDFDPFADVTPSGEDDKKQNDNKKKRKGLIIAIIVGACVVAALLALLGVISCNSGVFGGDGRNATGDSAATSSTLASGASAAATTATGATGSTTTPTQATTAPSATEPRGTEASDTEKATEEPVEYVTVKVVRGYTFEEAKEMCLKAAQKVPQMRFVAWDVAITPDGPTFIEGNSFPSHAIPQFAAHYPDGIGILPEFRKFIDI